MFITIEGGEGAGKTSAMACMEAFFTARKKKVLLTREPGGTLLGEELRAIVLSPENTNFPPLAEVFLYLADRVHHVETVIKPALEKGVVVICDRYTDSTLVYQGGAQGLCVDMLRNLNTIATGGLIPECTILLDVDPVVGLQRTKKRQLDNAVYTEETRYENEELSFHIALRNAYLALAEQEQRILVVDANATQDVVHRQILELLARITAQNVE